VLVLVHWCADPDAWSVPSSLIMSDMRAPARGKEFNMAQNKTYIFIEKLAVSSARAVGARPQ